MTLTDALSLRCGEAFCPPRIWLPKGARVAGCAGRLPGGALPLDAEMRETGRMVDLAATDERANRVSRVTGTLSANALLAAPPERVWDEITNVDIHSYPQPWYFRLAGIPHPLRAEVLASGVGGQRIAYFASGKRFIQRITKWEPLREYAFTFNPEKGFRVVFVFDLSDGIVQIPTGSYLLTQRGNSVLLKLSTEYSIDRRLAWILGPPVRLGLRTFQRYLLLGIGRNVMDR